MTSTTDKFDSDKWPEGHATQEIRTRLIELLSKRNLFDEKFAAEVMPELQASGAAGVRAIGAAMGEAVACQADSLAAGLEREGSRAAAGGLRARARIAHADWKRVEGGEER